MTTQRQQLQQPTRNYSRPRTQKTGRLKFCEPARISMCAHATGNNMQYRTHEQTNYMSGPERKKTNVNRDASG